MAGRSAFYEFKLNTAAGEHLEAGGTITDPGHRMACLLMRPGS